MTSWLLSPPVWFRALVIGAWFIFLFFSTTHGIGSREHLTQIGLYIACFVIGYLGRHYWIEKGHR